MFHPRLKNILSGNNNIFVMLLRSQSISYLTLSVLSGLRVCGLPFW